MRISSNFDDQGGEQFKDRYWGDVPMFLKTQYEIRSCHVNPDYIDLITGLLEGEVSEENVSSQLFFKVRDFVSRMYDKNLLTEDELIILDVIEGRDPCKWRGIGLDLPDSVLQCDQMIACDQMLLCDDSVVQP